MKVCFDTAIVLAAIVFSLCFFRNVTGVREGTLIAAFLVGFLIKLLQKPMRPLKRLLIK